MLPCAESSRPRGTTGSSPPGICRSMIFARHIKTKIQRVKKPRGADNQHLTPLPGPAGTHENEPVATATGRGEEPKTNKHRPRSPPEGAVELTARPHHQGIPLCHRRGPPIITQVVVTVLAAEIPVHPREGWRHATPVLPSLLLRFGDHSGAPRATPCRVTPYHEIGHSLARNYRLYIKQALNARKRMLHTTSTARMPSFHATLSGIRPLAFRPQITEMRSKTPLFSSANPHASPERD